MRKLFVLAVLLGASMGSSSYAGTVSITSSFFNNGVDNNNNGFVQSATLNWNDSSAFSNVPVGEDVYFRVTGATTWTYLGSTTSHFVTGSTNPVFFNTPAGGATQGAYDFQIQCFVLGSPNTLSDVRDNTNDPNLAAVKFETTAQDNTPVPVINSAPTASGALGAPFQYTITATNNPIAFNAFITGATVLPLGLTINTSTGVISGTPMAFGKFPITLVATNSGQTSTATLTLDIHYPVTGAVGIPFYFYFFPINPVTGGTITASPLPPGLQIAALDPTYAMFTLGHPIASAIFGLPTTAGTTSVTATGVFPSETDVATIDITIIPTPPPSSLITGITISRDPVRVSTDTTFTAVSQQLAAGAQVVFVFLENGAILANGVQVPTTFGSGAVTRQFTDPGNYTAFAAVFDGHNVGFYSQNFMVEALQPNTSATTVLSGAVTNPDNQVAIAVPAGVGGVLDLDITGGTASGAVAARDDTVLNTIGGRSSVQGIDVGSSRRNLALKFTGKGIYILTTVVNGKKARRMLPIGAAETGEPLSVAAPRDTGTNSIGGRSSVSGKFFLNPGKRDQVKLSGTVTLPAGLDLTSAQSIDVGLGNVVETVTVSKGTGSSSDGKLKFQLKAPKKSANAAFAITVTSPQLDQQGFDTEGISAHPKSTLNIQVAFVIGGVPYFTTVPVSAKATGKTTVVQISAK